MAVEVEAAGQVDEFLRVLRRRIWWIIIPLSVIGSLGTFFAVVVPKKYVVNTKVMVRDGDSQTGKLGEAAAIEGAVAKINITSPARIDSVLNKMAIPEWRNLTASEQTDYREDLTEDLSVSTPTMARDANQQLVEITFQHTDASRALQFIQTLSKSWTEEVLQRHLAREETELRETLEMLNDLNKERAQVVEDGRRIRTEHGIAPTPVSELFSAGDSRPASFAMQDQLNSDIVDLAAEIEEADLKIERDTAEWATMPEFEEALAQGESGSADKRIEEINDEIELLRDERVKYGWSPSHSRYRIIEDRIAGLKERKSQLAAERQRAQFETTDLVENKARLELKLEINKLTTLRDQKIRQRKNLLDRLVRVDNDNQQLQDALSKTKILDRKEAALSETIAGLRGTASELEIRVQKLSSPEGNPFEVLQRPTLPIKPTSPNPWVISIGSILFGLALGFGLAILKEYSKSCFRSARELNRVMTHPVLGTVNAIKTRRERARAFLMRSVLGGGSLLFVLSVGYVTWAWANKPEALTQPLIDAIQKFREILT